MKKIILFLALGCALAMSCKKENGEWGRRGNSATIGVNVSDINGPATKAGAAGEQLFDSFVVDTIGGQEIRLDAYVSDFNPEACGEETKGKIIGDSEDKVEYGEIISSFSMMAYANAEWHKNTIGEGHGSIGDPYTDNDNPYFGPSAVTKEDDGWSIEGTPEWINDIDMTFWSWKGKQPAAAAGSSGYDYSSATISDFVNEGQTDLIYAYNKEKRKFDDEGEITEGTGTYNSDYEDKMNIKFYHALSAVRFDVSGLLKNGLHLKKVTLSGIVKQADCAISVGTGNKLTFTWTPESTTGNTTSISTGTLTDSDFTLDGLDEDETEKSLMAMNSDEFLFLIPQEVNGKGIEIEIEYYTDDPNATAFSKVALSHDKNEKWEPGKYYTYRLNASSVKLAITKDSSTGEVTVKNTSSTGVVVRLAIVANWCIPDTDTKIKECPLSAISFTNKSDKISDVPTTDGYFYLGHFAAGDSITLFDGYTVTDTSSQPSGAVLRITIVGQAVKAGTTESWNDVAKLKQ